MTEKKDEKGKKHCTAFCPECGSDLYFMNGECYCKTNGCAWHCNCENCK
ncbi:MAG: hypothetical protein ACLFPF_05670 [Halanaerobiales bacterium]